jgi:hypothetical protein
LIDSLADRIIENISHVNGLYHRLIIVLAPPGKGKTIALRVVHERLGLPMININLELSQRMLELTERQRSLQLPGLLSEIVNKPLFETVLLDNIELLFDVSLKQNPLILLQGLSRNKTLVVAWSGTLEHGQIVYGVPSHPEYMRYPIEDMVIICPVTP